MEVPFSEQRVRATSYEGIEVILSIYVYSSTNRDTQYLYARYIDYNLIWYINPKLKDSERDKKIADLRKKLVDELLELFVIYYDNGYTEIIKPI